LFYAGIRPAVNAGLSVSRVGGNAQIKAMKKVAGPLRLELAQFRELAAFAAFGSDLDPQTQKALNRGIRLQEILKQGQYVPMSVEKQVLVIYAVTKGYLDNVPQNKVKDYEDQLFAFADSRGTDALTAVKTSLAIDDKSEPLVKQLLEDFGKQFATA